MTVLILFLLLDYQITVPKSHQMVQENPFNCPQVSHETEDLVEVFLFTVQLLKLPGTAQLRVTVS